MSVQTWDPQLLSVVFGTVLITHFAEDSMIEFTPNSDGFKLSKGAQGDSVRTRIADDSGVIKITLQATSPSNVDLQEIYDGDRAEGTGVLPFLAKDNSSDQAVLNAPSAWIKKAPDWTRSKELGQTVWEIETGDAAPVQGAGFEQ